MESVLGAYKYLGVQVLRHADLDVRWTVRLGSSAELLNMYAYIYRGESICRLLPSLRQKYREYK